jgi:hypothetical protein
VIFPHSDLRPVDFVLLLKFSRMGSFSLSSSAGPVDFVLLKFSRTGSFSLSSSAGSCFSSCDSSLALHRVRRWLSLCISFLLPTRRSVLRSTLPLLDSDCLVMRSSTRSGRPSRFLIKALISAPGVLSAPAIWISSFQFQPVPTKSVSR